MKKLHAGLVVAGVLAVSGGVYASVQHFAGRYLDSRQVAAAPAECTHKGVPHHMTATNGTFSPAQVTAKQCDTLTLSNGDSALRKIAFGAHDRHTTYDSVTERVLKQGQSFTVTLNKTGTFTVHDHLHQEVSGDFTVIK